MATDQMSKRRKRSVELPDEMLFEILSWLPAKSVCISKCCSKSFLNLTNSPTFAIKQSQNSLLKDDSYFFIQDYFMDHKIIRNTEIHSSLPASSSVTDQVAREKLGVPFKFLRFVDKNSVRILASTHGLLLCQTKSPSKLFICNPITQWHSFIPSPVPHDFTNFCEVIYSFECNNNNDEDYKLYALHEDYFQSPHNSTLVCKMYIPKQGVWKERETRFFSKRKCLIINQLPVFYKAAIHFIIDIPPVFYNAPRWRRQLVSYNVESGVSRVIELPNGEVGIFKWGEVGSKKESICLVNLKVDKSVGYTFKIWVLSYHESSSGGWSNIFSVSLKELGLDYGKCSQIIGFTVMNGRSLIFATKTKVYDYDLSGKREARLEKVCDHHQLTSTVILLPYSDTLRSCGNY